MKIWTYLEAKTKVLTDMDLLDETNIKQNELAGYFNDALTEAESEIGNLYKDYLKTKYYVPLVSGTSRYALPSNIFANKIRGIVYSSGSVIYQVKRFRRRNMFENIAFTEAYGVSDDYRYDLVNDAPGQAVLELHPTSRETSVMAPVASISAPMILWYIRGCTKIPMVAVGGNPAEYCNPEVVMPTQVSTGAGTIQTYSGTSTTGTPQQGLPGCTPGSIAYITGDAVKLLVGPNGTVPGGLTAGTVYYVIAGANGLIKLATTRVNALAGTSITLTTTGTVYFIITVAATTAIQNATLLDVPEFTTFLMQWARCKCFSKEGLGAIPDDEKALLIASKKQMVDTLTNSVPDDADEIEADFSHYQEMS